MLSLKSEQKENEMSTLALIARKTDKGFACILVNWDGYTDRVGKTLREVFNTDESARELIALGDCSDIAGARSIDDVEAYCRDRNKKWDTVAPRTFSTILDAQIRTSPIYTYVWDDEEWTAFKGEDKLAW